MAIQKKYLNKIIDNIIEAADLKYLPEAEESYFRSQMEAQIIRRLGIIIIENLDENGLAEYEKILGKDELPSAGEFQEFLENHIPEYEKKLKIAIDEFINEVMALMMK